MMRIITAQGPTEGSSCARAHPALLQEGRGEGTQPFSLSGAAQAAALSLRSWQAGCSPRWPAERLTHPSTSLSAPSLRDLASSSQTRDKPTASPCPGAAPVPVAHPSAWNGKIPRRRSGAAGSPPAKQCNSSGIALLLSTQLLSTFALQNSEPGRRKAPLPLLPPPDPEQNPTRIPAHGAELLPSTRNIAAILPLTIHLCLN